MKNQSTERNRIELNKFQAFRFSPIAKRLIGYCCSLGFWVSGEESGTWRTLILGFTRDRSNWVRSEPFVLENKSCPSVPNTCKGARCAWGSRAGSDLFQGQVVSLLGQDRPGSETMPIKRNAVRKFTAGQRNSSI